MADQTLKKICLNCGKPAGNGRRAGSLTGFLFGGGDCRCRLGDAAVGRKPAAAMAEIDFCPKCGLQIVSRAKAGSLTGFLFQSTRCKCPRDKDFEDGRMSDRFWKLKQTDSGTTFAKETGATGTRRDSTIGLVAGATIGGAYQIVEPIGRGGMGEVYLARHLSLGKKCALKVIPPEQVTEVGWQRFQLEAKAVAKLDHLNLVRVTDLGIHDGCLPYYAMDYVEGKNLADLIADRGPMPLATAIEIFTQVCDGVECAHRSGILHRDLKPANIMVSTDKLGAKQVKILDFGLAKLTKQDRANQSLTAMGDIFGSPFYMSPEQCQGERLDNRSDIYSLGCTMFECLVGQPPFTGHLAASVMFSHQEADPPSLASIAGEGKFPPGMEIVMAKLLRKNPAERYQTLSQLKADLELVAAGKEVLPVYRSRDARDEPASRQSVAREQSAPSTFGEPDLKKVMIGGVSIAVLILIPLTVYFLNPQSFSKGSSVFSMANLFGREKEAKAPPPKPDTVVQQVQLGVIKKLYGNTYRIWNVPAGQLCPFRLEYYHGGELTIASPETELHVPENAHVCIVLLDTATLDTGAFKALQDGSFEEVEFSKPDQVIVYAPFFARFKSVRGIRLGSRTLLGLRDSVQADQAESVHVVRNLNRLWNDQQMTSSIQAINCLPYLKHLTIFSQIKANSLSKLVRLKQLQSICLTDDGYSLPECLSLFRSSTCLKSLSICYSPVPPDQLKLISSLHSLERFAVGGMIGTHEQLAALAGLPNLRQLDMPTLFVRGDLLADLRKFKALEEINVTRLSGWSEQKIKEFRYAMPGVSFKSYESEQDLINTFYSLYVTP